MGFHMKGNKLYYKKKNAVIARRKGERVCEDSMGRYYIKRNK